MQRQKNCNMLPNYVTTFTKLLVIATCFNMMFVVGVGAQSGGTFWWLNEKLVEQAKMNRDNQDKVSAHVLVAEEVTVSPSTTTVQPSTLRPKPWVSTVTPRPRQNDRRFLFPDELLPATTESLPSITTQANKVRFVDDNRLDGQRQKQPQRRFPKFENSEWIPIEAPHQKWPQQEMSSYIEGQNDKNSENLEDMQQVGAFVNLMDLSQHLVFS